MGSRGHSPPRCLTFMDSPLCRPPTAAVGTACRPPRSDSASAHKLDGLDGTFFGAHGKPPRESTPRNCPDGGAEGAVS